MFIQQTQKMDKLSIEIIEGISSLLDFKSLINFSNTCHHIRNATERERWKVLTITSYYHQIPNAKINFRQIYSILTQQKQIPTYIQKLTVWPESERNIINLNNLLRGAQRTCKGITKNGTHRLQEFCCPFVSKTVSIRVINRFLSILMELRCLRAITLHATQWDQITKVTVTNRPWPNLEEITVHGSGGNLPIKLLDNGRLTTVKIDKPAQHHLEQLNTIQTFNSLHFISGGYKTFQNYFTEAVTLERVTSLTINSDRFHRLYHTRIQVPCLRRIHCKKDPECDEFLHTLLTSCMNSLESVVIENSWDTICHSDLIEFPNVRSVTYKCTTMRVTNSVLGLLPKMFPNTTDLKLSLTWGFDHVDFSKFDKIQRVTIKGPVHAKKLSKLKSPNISLSPQGEFILTK